MFGNKKPTLPPKPKPPEVDEILEDLKDSINKDDVAFKLLAQESAYNDSSTQAEWNDLNNVYEQVKTYLDINKKLKVLKQSINDNEKELQSSVQSMIELSEDIKEQAQAALIE